MTATLSSRSLGHSSLRRGAGQVSTNDPATANGTIVPPAFIDRQLHWNLV
ncbi:MULTISPECIES: hypothetical protein [unclassified Mesorhizobium]|nr:MULTISPECIES: hypothetical protein [unclassified Mesorhizobium]